MTKKIVFVIAAAAAMMACSHEKSPYPGYKLVFAEEFDTDGAPNPQVWDYEQGFVRNHEAQYYQADNAKVEDGCLVIEGRCESVNNPHYNADSERWNEQRQQSQWTSASLYTKHDPQGNGYAWGYGIYEVRAKVPAHLGCWPAIWLLGCNGDWPYCGEIDIMEYYPNDGRESILANVAWGGEHGCAIWDSSVHFIDEMGDPDWADKFHVWRMDYAPEHIRLYCDDALLNETLLDQTANTAGARGAGYNPFSSGQKHYMLLNLALGGNNGGSLDDTPSPCRYYVDYVRVYEPE